MRQIGSSGLFLVVFLAACSGSSSKSHSPDIVHLASPDSNEASSDTGLVGSDADGDAGIDDHVEALENEVVVVDSGSFEDSAVPQDAETLPDAADASELPLEDLAVADVDPVEVLDVPELLDAGADACDACDAPDVCTPSCEGKECGGDGCGGDCGTCQDAGPCTSHLCDNGSCVQEPAAGPCSDDDPCTSGDLCAAGACVPGAELCGGGCPLCPDGENCQASSDCASGVCGNNVCLVPACDDGVANGGESDVDCGGQCASCNIGYLCNLNSDCIEDVCAQGVCAVPPCVDGGQTGIPSHTRLIGSDLTPLDVICRPADSVFSLIVLPDTQMYTAASSPYPEMFTEQTKFIRVMYNHSLNRMIFAIHLGDVVNNAKNPVEWPIARTAMDKLKAFTWEGVEHFMPYDIAWGDHDVLSYWDDEVYPASPRPKYSSEILSGLFSAANYKSDQTTGPQEWWKWFFRSYKNRFARNSYHFFDAGGDEYMLLFLEYCPSQEVIDWAAQRLSWYAAGPKDRRAIIVAHSFIDTAGGLHDTKYSTGHEKCWEFENGALNNGSPSDVFQQLVVPYNVHFVLNGHDNGGGWKGGTYSRMKVPAEISGADNDRDVHVFLSNYQYVGSADSADEIPNGTVGSGLGYFRMMRFHPDQDRIHVTVWSEYSNENNNDKWNPTYAEDDPGKLHPLNFAGNPDSPFNEDEVCSQIDTAAANPGRCKNWDHIPGLCGDIESYAADYQLAHDGPPYSSFVTQCNRFSVTYPMTGSDSLP